jgi:hypothetical protein
MASAARSGEPALASAARSGPSARALQRLRALVVCLTFAISVPAASHWELGSNWTARAVATLVSAAVGSAALPRASHPGVTPQGVTAQAVAASQRAALLVAPADRAGGVCAPARWEQNLAPGFDGQRLYLEQCSFSC